MSAHPGISYNERQRRMLFNIVMDLADIAEEPVSYVLLGDRVSIPREYWDRIQPLLRRAHLVMLPERDKMPF